jgi:hypothetical protein
MGEKWFHLSSWKIPSCGLQSVMPICKSFYHFPAFCSFLAIFCDKSEKIGFFSLLFSPSNSLTHFEPVNASGDTEISVVPEGSVFAGFETGLATFSHSQVARFAHLSQLYLVFFFIQLFFGAAILHVGLDPLESTSAIFAMRCNG